ncbi:MAG: hypothetical protein ACOYD6_03895 [Limnochordia bacterium]|jgi:hypothetical protein
MQGRLIAAEAVLFDWKCRCGNPVIMEICLDDQRESLCIDCFRRLMAEITKDSFWRALTDPMGSEG